MRRICRRAAIGGFAIFMACCTAYAATAQSAVELANRNTVGIISGSVKGTYARFAQDMADVLDQDGELRVLSMLGKGSVQNIADLLYLKGVDFAIVQSDVLESYRSRGVVPDIDDRISYITKLYNEEIHLVARRDIKSLDDLAGQVVNVGPEKSGTEMTSRIVIKALGLDVETINMNNTESLKSLRAGDIAAAFFVVGKPATYFKELPKSAGLHFLTIKPRGGLGDVYLKTTLGSSDYPNLIGSGRKVDTIAVGAVLAVYQWRPNTDRYRRSAQFIDRFFSNLDILKTGYHPKWKEVNLTVRLPGWKRFDAADQWLRTNR